MQGQYQAQDEGTFTLEDVVLVVRRRLWSLVVPTIAGTLLGVVVAIVWPATYEAYTDVFILAQSISENVVESSIVNDTEARFDQIRREILARDALSQIIADFNLYADDDLPQEYKIERLRGNISIEPLTSDIVNPRGPIQINSFRIAFQSPDRSVVAGVANRLRETIIDTNLENRRKAAEGSSDFIAREIERREKQLRGLTTEIATFRAEHPGTLPDELPECSRTWRRRSRSCCRSCWSVSPSSRRRSSAPTCASYGSASSLSTSSSRFRCSRPCSTCRRACAWRGTSRAISSTSPRFTRSIATRAASRA